jgi:ribosomal protein L23
MAKKEEAKQQGKNVNSDASNATQEFDPYQIILSPLATEKCIRLIEFNNTLVFLVHPRSTKPEIKKAVEELFKVKVKSVNVQNSFKGNKRAFVTLTQDYLASDISADLGFI